jgi:hypothetical protein
VKLENGKIACMLMDCKIKVDGRLKFDPVNMYTKHNRGRYAVAVL